MNATYFLIWNYIMLIMLLVMMVLFIIQGGWCIVHYFKEKKEKRLRAKRLWDANAKIRVRIQLIDCWGRILRREFKDKTAKDYTLSCFEEMLDGGYLIGEDGSSCRMMWYFSEEED